MSIYIHYVFFILITSSLISFLNVYLSGFKKTIFFAVGLLIFIGSIILKDFSYALDLVIFLQLLVFIYESFRGGFYKKEKNNFYDMKNKDLFLHIFYILFYKPIYFLYVIMTFPERLSEDSKFFGFVFVYIALFILMTLVIISKHFRKINLKN